MKCLQKEQEKRNNLCRRGHENPIFQKQIYFHLFNDIKGEKQERK